MPGALRIASVSDDLIQLHADRQRLPCKMIGLLKSFGDIMQINLAYDAAARAAPRSFRDGMQTAANMLMRAFTNNITINIAVGYGEVPAYNGLASEPLPTGYSEGYFWGAQLSYAAVRQALVGAATSADDRVAVASLPTGTSVAGQNTIYVADAELSAFGLTRYGDYDGAVGMNKGLTGNALVSGALHELTHAMGRSDGAVQDLFRFTSPGNRLVSTAIPAPASYFSLDGGNTRLANFGQGSDPGDFLNDALTPNDAFDENVGNLGALTELDRRVMDILGFHRFDESLPKVGSLNPVYRFYDTSTQNHFYTQDAAEKDWILRTLPSYQYEGSAWSTPDAGPNTTDVYRFYDTATRDHFYTTDVAERDSIIANLHTYQYEGVAFEAYTSQAAAGSGGLTLERFYNTISGVHHYSASADETNAINSGRVGLGWVEDGPSFVVHTPLAGGVA